MAAWDHSTTSLSTRTTEICSKLFEQEYTKKLTLFGNIRTLYYVPAFVHLTKRASRYLHPPSNVVDMRGRSKSSINGRSTLMSYRPAPPLPAATKTDVAVSAAETVSHQLAVLVPVIASRDRCEGLTWDLMDWMATVNSVTDMSITLEWPFFPWCDTCRTFETRTESNF